MRIKTTGNEESLGPREIDVHNVQYWSHTARQLEKSQINKAKKFIEFDCIKYAGNGVFVCEPLPGYNSTTYTIDKSPNYEKTFACNCQCWQKKLKEGEIIPEGANCSHVLSLYFCFKMNKKFDGYDDRYGDISLSS